MILAYDSDAAGQGAAERWYGWEQRYDIQLEVADLPLGRDPADVWRDDPQLLVKAVEAAKPFMEFRIDRALGAADKSSVEGRARAAEIAAAIIAEHPSDLVRDQYVMRVAAGLDIDADRLRDAVARPAPGGGVRRRGAGLRDILRAPVRVRVASTGARSTCFCTPSTILRWSKSGSMFDCSPIRSRGGVRGRRRRRRLPRRARSNGRTGA